MTILPTPKQTAKARRFIDLGKIWDEKGNISYEGKRTRKSRQQQTQEELLEEQRKLLSTSQTLHGHDVGKTEEACLGILKGVYMDGIGTCLAVSIQDQRLGSDRSAPIQEISGLASAIPE